MKLTAQYKNGVLIPEHPIHPKSTTLHLSIPDDELEPAASPRAPLEEWQTEIISRLPWMERVWALLEEPPPMGQDDPLNEKELERCRAFETRAEIRRAHGRPL